MTESGVHTIGASKDPSHLHWLPKHPTPDLLHRHEHAEQATHGNNTLDLGQHRTHATLIGRRAVPVNTIRALGQVQAQVHTTTTWTRFIGTWRDEGLKRRRGSWIE
ncbi:hypothetical protein AX16_003828 [Volvariella volvacea WC 439]|nr:hypothetical protein AX16_003828 [Volvariella volvacea WC 439]